MSLQIGMSIDQYTTTQEQLKQFEKSYKDYERWMRESATGDIDAVRNQEIANIESSNLTDAEKRSKIAEIQKMNNDTYRAYLRDTYNYYEDMYEQTL